MALINIETGERITPKGVPPRGVEFSLSGVWDRAEMLEMAVDDPTCERGFLAWQTERLVEALTVHGDEVEMETTWGFVGRRWDRAKRRWVARRYWAAHRRSWR